MGDRMWDEGEECAVALPPQQRRHDSDASRENAKEAMPLFCDSTATAARWHLRMFNLDGASHGRAAERL